MSVGTLRPGRKNEQVTFAVVPGRSSAEMLSLGEEANGPYFDLPWAYADLCEEKFIER